MNERIKIIRKALGLSQDEFGDRIGVTRSAISKIESSERGVTDQMTKSICREFNVDYSWITTGIGNMFTDVDIDIIKLIDRIMTGENEFHKNLFKTLAKLDESDLIALEKIVDKFLYIKKADV